MGAAIRDYFRQGKSAQLKVLSSLFDDDEMPVAHLFRSYHEMPPLEQRALNEARGKVLDVGAGAGCHALALQERGLDVTAGEVDYQMTYRNIKGKRFDWLYADFVVLAECCRQCGLKCEILAQGNHYDYLARIVQM